MKTAFDEILSVGRRKTSAIMSPSEIKSRVEQRNGRTRGSVIHSDYCYKKTNKGSRPLEERIFFYIEMGKYRFIGLNYAYDGSARKTDGAD